MPLVSELNVLYPSDCPVLNKVRAEHSGWGWCISDGYIQYHLGKTSLYEHRLVVEHVAACRAATAARCRPNTSMRRATRTYHADYFTRTQIHTQEQPTMTPAYLEVLHTLSDWYRALALAGGVAAGGLFAFLGDKSQEDELVAEANEFCLDVLSDADTVRGIACMTDAQLRDQITVEQALDMAEEADRRRSGWLWN